jgi:hypothetical protein
MARQYEHVITGVDAGGNVVTKGTEVRRSVVCPVHHKSTELFLGVNSLGWIFRCSGGRISRFAELTDPHSFVAEPPKEATE